MRGNVRTMLQGCRPRMVCAGRSQRSATAKQASIGAEKDCCLWASAALLLAAGTGSAGH